MKPFTTTRNIDLGGIGPSTDLVLSDSALARVTAGTLRIGDATADTGDITVTGNVSSHPGFATLSLQTQNGKINEANGATITVANLALHAGTGIGTTGDFRTAVTKLAFANQSGAIHISNTGAVTLTNVDSLTGATIPGNIHSSSVVGSVYTLLHSSDGIKGQISYNGQPLADGATLVLADGNRYQISYKANGGHDVTLTRIANVPAQGTGSDDPGWPSRCTRLLGGRRRPCVIRRFNGGPTSQRAGELAGGNPPQPLRGRSRHPRHHRPDQRQGRGSLQTVPRPAIATGGPGTDDGPGRLCHHPLPGRIRGTTRRLPGHGPRPGSHSLHPHARGDALGVRARPSWTSTRSWRRRTRAVDAVLDDGNATLRHRADDLFTEINTGT